MQRNSCFNFLTSCSVLSVIIGGLFLLPNYNALNRTEQNRTEQEVLTGTEENLFGSQEHYKFPQGICKDVFQICKGNEENCKLGTQKRNA
jgi:hypothetical protein